MVVLGDWGIQIIEVVKRGDRIQTCSEMEWTRLVSATTGFTPNCINPYKRRHDLIK